MFGEFIQAKRDEFLTRWQEYMYDKSYQDQIAFWNMQNEYNSPSAQRDRLDSAGLNSAAVMSGGVSNTSSGSASGSTPGTPGGISTSQVQLGQMANLAQVFAQVRQMNAEAESIEIENSIRKWDLLAINTLNDPSHTWNNYSTLEYYRDLRQITDNEADISWNNLHEAYERARSARYKADVDLIDRDVKRWAQGEGYLSYPFMKDKINYLIGKENLDITKSEKTLKELEVALKEFDVDLKQLMRENPMLMQILSITSAFGFTGDQLLSIIGQFIPNFNIFKSTSRSSNVN